MTETTLAIKIDPLGAVQGAADATRAHPLPAVADMADPVLSAIWKVEGGLGSRCRSALSPPASQERLMRIQDDPGRFAGAVPRRPAEAPRRRP